MSKTQKKIIAITLFLMALIVLFPTKYLDFGTAGRLDQGRPFVFSAVKGQIDVQKTIFELLAVAFVGGAIVALLGLKKEK